MLDLINLLFKFSIAGIAGVCTNFIFTVFFKEFLHLNKFLSNTLGIVIALILNFFINRNWTFSVTNQLLDFQLFKFSIIVLVSIILNHFIVYLFTSKINFNFYYSKLIAVAIVFIWNFVMHTIYTFDYLEQF
tara:strand:- start:304 stop:699 length:396 start_codon:yes stop_codon:yes gene_type:complete